MEMQDWPSSSDTYIQKRKRNNFKALQVSLCLSAVELVQHVYSTNWFAKLEIQKETKDKKLSHFSLSGVFRCLFFSDQQSKTQKDWVYCDTKQRKKKKKKENLRNLRNWNQLEFLFNKWQKQLINYQNSWLIIWQSSSTMKHHTSCVIINTVDSVNMAEH